MKKNTYVLAMLLGLTACNNKPAFKVEGEITGAADKMLYLEQTSLEGILALDSVELDNKGNFKFTAERPASPDFYRLRIENKIINFSVDSTETVNVHADYPQFATEYRIDGSENNLKIKELSQLQAKLQSQVNKLGSSGLPAGKVQDSLLSLVRAYKDNVKRNYIFTAPNKPYAYFALFQQLNGYMIFDPLTSKDDIKCFAAVATSMNNLYPHADRSRNLYNMVIKGMKNTRAPKEVPVEIPAEKVTETSIIDIALKDIKGNERTLTALKGKVILIDFTAYASPASGARNLALRELYDKYAAQGLEIYQISLDADEHFWKTSAVNLPWICVRDPQGVYSPFANLYGVTQLPTAFLANRNNELSIRLNEKMDLEEAIKKLL